MLGSKKAKTFSRREFLEGVLSPLKNMGESWSESPVKSREKGNGSGAWRKVGKINHDNCIAWGGGNCQICYLVCPLRDEAIVMNDQKPFIVPRVCDGCGICEKACVNVNFLGAISIVRCA